MLNNGGNQKFSVDNYKCNSASSYQTVGPKINDTKTTLIELLRKGTLNESVMDEVRNKGKIFTPHPR